MASSSEVAQKLGECLDARTADPVFWSVAEVKKFIAGYSKQRGYGKILSEKLEAAAVTQLTRKRTISSFRACTFQSKEGKGPLYNLVKELAPPPVEAASDENAYTSFHAKHPQVVLPEELAFLLEGVRKDRFKSAVVYEISLDDNEARLLERALREKLIPEWLMRPCSFLTFEENLDIRVQVARLWVAGSKLPVFVGSSLTFEEVRRMDGRVEKPEGFPLDEDLPSKFLLQMREKAIDGIYYGYTVIYPRGEELPDDCTAHRKAYGNIGYPMHAVGVPPIYKAGKYKGGLRYATITTDPEWNVEEYEDSVEEDLFDFKMSETPAMGKLLAKLLFHREV